MRYLVLAAAAAITLFANPVLADDWVATKLRGVVLQLVDGAWVELNRGDVVPDDRVVRTLRTGRVTFQRDEETIDLGADTQVQIFDRTGRSFTTVKQYFGTVAVEADVRKVQHFAVQTPYLAAVVKGTRFTVSSSDRGAKVEVTRGSVAVRDRDTHQSTTVTAGQSAASSEGEPLKVSGRGDLPVIYGANGQAITFKEAAAAARGEAKEAKAEAREAKAEARESRKDSDSSSNGNGGGSSNGNSGGNSGNGNSGNGKKD
jgi:hypothetical protein